MAAQVAAATSDISRDYNLFVHIMDANNELAAQYGARLCHCGDEQLAA